MSKTTENSAGLSTEARARNLYDLGSTTIFAHAGDPRFAYALYVPKTITQPGHRVELVVVVHGTGRQFTNYRDAFAEFGRWQDCLILCPLFPVGVRGDGNPGGFKHLAEGDIRYDEVLLNMVEEVGRKYETSFDKFALFGYSGGGQFVNRFGYLHPERLWALSIGAPGSVTLLDTNQNWWVGIGDIEQRYGKAFDLEALRRVPVHMVVGKADIETWEITHREGGPHYMPGANSAGANRQERLASLRDSFERAGVDVTFDVIDNMPHDGMQSVPAVQDFLADVLRKKRAAA
ncbi:alpha/beta hydrolase [Pandoraea sputorum]|uniref:alpha/beta hydrolase n=1 Tax=Pandoraea sputorum TaxID=93222 RepID=UPI0012401ED7|nr:alpha/beta hydrolase [Pandoraea sputorum]VVE84069.1 hydrolase [Pandoraea sputorum]